MKISKQIFFSVLCLMMSNAVQSSDIMTTATKDIPNMAADIIRKNPTLPSAAAMKIIADDVKAVKLANGNYQYPNKVILTPEQIFNNWNNSTGYIVNDDLRPIYLPMNQTYAYQIKASDQPEEYTFVELCNIWAQQKAAGSFKKNQPSVQQYTMAIQQIQEKNFAMIPELVNAMSKLVAKMNPKAVNAPGEMPFVQVYHLSELNYLYETENAILAGLKNKLYGIQEKLDPTMLDQKENTQFLKENFKSKSSKNLKSVIAKK